MHIRMTAQGWWQRFDEKQAGKPPAHAHIEALVPQWEVVSGVVPIRLKLSAFHQPPGTKWSILSATWNLERPKQNLAPPTDWPWNVASDGVTQREVEVFVDTRLAANGWNLCKLQGRLSRFDGFLVVSLPLHLNVQNEGATEFSDRTPDLDSISASGWFIADGRFAGEKFNTQYPRVELYRETVTEILSGPVPREWRPQVYAASTVNELDPLRGMRIAIDPDFHRVDAEHPDGHEGQLVYHGPKRAFNSDRFALRNERADLMIDTHALAHGSALGQHTLFAQAIERNFPADRPIDERHMSAGVLAVKFEVAC